MALWKVQDTYDGAPKWLEAKTQPAPHPGMVENPNAVYPNDIDQAVFIDDAEAGVATNRDKGLQTPGWHVYNTYTTEGGVVRHRSECLVAVGEADPVVTGDDGVSGTGDDEVAADPAP